MEVVLALVIGTLYGGGLYLMMRRNLIQLIIGLGLLSHGANLLIFTAAGLHRDAPPLVPDDAQVPAGLVADPLAQALILTAIVIGLGVTAVMLAFAVRIYKARRTLMIDECTESKW